VHFFDISAHTVPGVHISAFLRTRVSRVSRFLRFRESGFSGFARFLRFPGFPVFGKSGIWEIPGFWCRKSGSFFELFFGFSTQNPKSRGMCHKSARIAFFGWFFGFEQKWVFSCFFETFDFSGNRVFATTVVGAFVRFDAHA